MASKIRILIVDDSSFMRMAIRGMLYTESDFEIVGTAADGVEAVEKTSLLRPDIVTMDVQMPRLDGISALKQIMHRCPTKVLLVTSLCVGGAENAFDALDAGAVDYIARVNLTESVNGREIFRNELVHKIRSAVSSPVSAKSAGAGPSISRAPRPGLPLASARLGKIRAVGIGASTGGPVAVQEVLSAIPAGFPFPIVVGIHMPALFTGPYAARLDQKCALTVREAKNGDVLQAGVVFLAPGGMHTEIVQQGGRMTVRVVSPLERSGYTYVPSVDILIESLSVATGGQAIGVVLTGMGSDGFKGMKALKASGGSTIVQNEETSTIYGMPRACVEGGVADAVLPLDQIGFELSKLR